VSSRKSWTYGHVELKPLLDPTNGKKIKTIRHGTKVWRLAESSGWILIAKKDPGAIEDVAGRVKKAIGWVKAAGNKTVSTRQMLPPGDSLIGTRVWGSLRKGESDWELGKVIQIKGSNVAVERISDRSIVTVARSAIRFGTVSKGTKVLARCDHPLKLEEAVIEKVTFPKVGDPVATISCGKNSKTRKEQLGALRSKSSWLPARK
jgi:hypothetical protein